MRSRHVLAVAVAAFALAGSASAATFTYTVALDGTQEVPPNGSPATGTAIVLLDTVANNITVDLSFQNLTTPQTAAHIHGPAAQGQNAGVLVGFPVGQFSGLVFPITDTIEGHILAGLTYVNVHTQQFPGGEIRGQLLAPVSVEPSTWGGIKGLYR